MAFLLQCLLLAGMTDAFAAESAVYRENFDNNEIGEGMALKNDNCYESSFNDGFAGKAPEDKAFGFARKTDSSDNNIYTRIYSPTTMKYIKYELNFLPGSEAFSNIRFKTGGDKPISPELYCNDVGDGQYYVLNRNAWNKIIYVITLDTTGVDKTKQDISCIKCKKSRGT